MKPILIADPDPEARKALALILKHRFGIEEVLEAGDVESLICALANFSPALLLLDGSLYGAPAVETCLLLQKAYPTLKIILLSADATDQAAAEKVNAAFVHKGAAPEKLVNTLTILLME